MSQEQSNQMKTLKLIYSKKEIIEKEYGQGVSMMSPINDLNIKQNELLKTAFLNNKRDSNVPAPGEISKK